MPNPAITITGNLTRDVELRFTPSGAAVANFSVATSDRRLNKQTNEWEDSGDPCFWDCTVWRQAAERLAELAWPKGHPVIVTGRIKQRVYQTRDGDKRRAYEVEVDTVGTDEAAVARRGSSQQRPAPTPAADPWAATTGTGGDPWAQQTATEPPW